MPQQGKDMSSAQRVRGKVGPVCPTPKLDPHLCVKTKKVNHRERNKAGVPGLGLFSHRASSNRSKIHRVKFYSQQSSPPLPSPGQGQTGWG